MKKIMGFALLLFVFGGLFAALAIEVGILVAAAIWGTAIVLAVMIIAGLHLIAD